MQSEETRVVCARVTEKLVGKQVKRSMPPVSARTRILTGLLHGL